MNDLEKYILENTGNQTCKWSHYAEIYDRHLSKFRGKAVNLVEFGVSHGGSLQIWKRYFGPKATIIGVDINPECKKLEEDRIKILIGDQGDRKFLKSILDDMPEIDILIDDGGHRMKQQVNTFEVLFPHIRPDGVYACEDLNTSYWHRYGGGYKKKGSFIEYSKNFIDRLNAWHSEQPHRLNVSEFTKTAGSLHYYDALLIIEKRLREMPYSVETGNPSTNFYLKKTLAERVERLWLRPIGYKEAPTSIAPNRKGK